MAKSWWCVDCRTPVALSRHGRCDVCDSNAVDKIEQAMAHRIFTPAPAKAENVSLRVAAY
jgi:hypothetical protein